MIKIVSFAAKLPLSIVEEVRTFCKEKGMKLGAFISEAIKEKIHREELLEDSNDIVSLRFEESGAIPLEDYFAKRKI